MVREQPAAVRKRCEGCGKVIPETQLTIFPDTRFCVQCQDKLEQDPHVFKRKNESQEETQAIEMQGNHLTAGNWSANLMDLTVKDAELRAMIQSGRWKEAREMVQSQSPEVQAALVMLDENPEEVLSLTGMDAEGKPAYLPAVVSRLPTETLAELIKPQKSDYLRYNPKVIRAMSPRTFARAIDETLDIVDQQELRTKVVWDWLQAVASMEDKNKAAELLRSMDFDKIEDAIMDRIEGMNLEETLCAVEGLGVSRLQGLKEGVSAGSPGRFIDDPEVAGILDVLYNVAPDIITEAMQRIAFRTG